MKQAIADHLGRGDMVLDFRHFLERLAGLTRFDECLDLLAPVTQTEEPVFDGDNPATRFSRQRSECVKIRLERDLTDIDFGVKRDDLCRWSWSTPGISRQEIWQTNHVAQFDNLRRSRGQRAVIFKTARTDGLTWSTSFSRASIECVKS